MKASATIEGEHTVKQIVDPEVPNNRSQLNNVLLA